MSKCKGEPTENVEKEKAEEEGDQEMLERNKSKNTARRGSIAIDW